MTPTVPSSDMGMASTTLSVLDSEPRNTQHTSAVSRHASSSSISISCTLSSMKRVESKLMPSSMPSGRSLRSSSSILCTPSATATALAPRCFFTPRPWAGLPSTRDMRRMSSKPSSTSATSDRYTVEPSCSRTTRPRRVSRSSASPITRTLTSRPSVSMRPAGSSTCSRCSAAITSVTVSPLASSFSASTQMRTLRSRAPPTITSPTPSTVCSFSLMR